MKGIVVEFDYCFRYDYLKMNKFLINIKTANIKFKLF